MSQDWGDNDDENRGRVSRVIISKVHNDGGQQRIDYDGVAGEKHTEVLRVQVFGFTNNPPAGAEGIVLAMNARDAPVLLGVEHPDKRPADDPSGSSRQYDAGGSSVYLDGSGNVHVKAGGADVVIEAPGKVLLKSATIRIEGNVEIEGNITHTGDYAQTGIHVDSNGPHTA